MIFIHTIEKRFPRSYKSKIKFIFLIGIFSLFGCEEDKKSSGSDAVTPATTTSSTDASADTTPADTSSTDTASTEATTTTDSTTTASTSTSNALVDSLSSSGILSSTGITELTSLLGSVSATAEKTIWVPCDTSTGISQGTFSFSGANNTAVQLYGEVCPGTSAVTSEPLTVLFVMDFSTVMTGTSWEAASDPTVNNTCNRLESVKAITQQIDLLRASFPTVNAGLLRFSSSYSYDYVRDGVSIRDYDSFKSFLSSTYFCGSDYGSYYANFKTALEGAYNRLASISGPKLVYLVSAGVPTAGGSSVQSASEAGLWAAQKLKNLSNLRLESIYLGYNPYTGQSRISDAYGFLQMLTGDSSRTKTLSQSAAFTSALTDSTFISSSAATAFNLVSAYNIASSATQNLTLSLLTQHPSKAGYWIFGTSPITLTSTAVGTVTPNAVNLKLQSTNASATSGSEFNSLITINFNATE